MDKFLKLLGFLSLIVVGLIINLLVVKVILSIGSLYGLSAITQFSFSQIYGLLFIISIIKLKIKDAEGFSFEKALTDTLTLCLTYLSIWGLAFLAYCMFF